VIIFHLAFDIYHLSLEETFKLMSSLQSKTRLVIEGDEEIGKGQAIATNGK